MASSLFLRDREWCLLEVEKGRTPYASFLQTPPAVLLLQQLQPRSQVVLGLGVYLVDDLGTARP